MNSHWNPLIWLTGAFNKNCDLISKQMEILYYLDDNFLNVYTPNLI